MKAWPFLGVFLVQFFLFLAHWFLYRTCIDFWPGLPPAAIPALRVAVLVLAFSFVAAALLSFRFSNPLVRLIYKAAAVWLGFLNYLFWAACLSWLVWFALRAVQLHPHPAVVRPWIDGSLSAAALVAAIYGMINARWIRVRRVIVHLPNLPAAWLKRKAVMISDLHLGHVNGLYFSRRVAAIAARLKPDLIFLPGDLFDGSKADLDALLGPIRDLAPPQGIFFSTGNHEEFGDPRYYLEPIARAGIRILADDQVTVDGLRIAGVSYGHALYPIRLRAILERMNLNHAQPTILLNHVPSKLPIVEQAGVNLQLSGHTHGGQIFPFTWITRRVFGPFTYGLHRFGALQVYTSSGCGTWGPPMRVGTHPEIVVLEFKSSRA